MAQTITDQEPLKFDVVSVVIDRSGNGGWGDEFPKHGTWRWTRIDLGSLIGYAYPAFWNRIFGIPNSLQAPDVQFDITAKMPRTLPTRNSA